MNDVEAFEHLYDIAIIGMVGRFPGANDLDEFWQNLRDGVETISFFTDEELLSAGISPATLSDPYYVKARGVLQGAELFDASFFGFTPKEAEITDPQQRIFLECAWEALEIAGYDSDKCGGRVAVYAGLGTNTYALHNILSNHDLIEAAGVLQTLIGNDRDNLTTRVSYRLNLKGPSVTVQTACSTSLVAVCLACQSLLQRQCDMALAGGVAINVPQKTGYFYQEGGIASPDGHCRTFDARAQGTVGGDGVGIVVLKRLADALADGDCIHAVIKGSAINNDGSLKVSYTAPSVAGQAEVIAEALAMAGVELETITFVEAHGTGTPLGDPIEIAALSQVFRASTPKKGFCAIGSVKTNVGHLDVTAGVVGLIKTVLALEHRQLPPSLHYTTPNPKIDFANSPFYVNTRLQDWQADGQPRRAGVSSFGFGGTNAHVVLEEAPPVEAAGESRPWQLLALSARTSAALEATTANLVGCLKAAPDLHLADVAYTLQVGRRAFGHRRTLVCRDLDDAATALTAMDPARVLTAIRETGERPVAFMFPGQGAQYVNMARQLYQVEPTFREQLDHCAQLLLPHLGLDLRCVLYPAEEKAGEAAQQLEQTWLTQPALFAIEYALAGLWLEWGIHPQAMIGHSVGEYVAACLAGVFALEEALALVSARGRLIQQLPGGAMLAAPLPEQEIQPLLGRQLSLAAINGPALCVVSGPTDAVEALHNRLAERGLQCRRLHTSHAFHSQMMEPIVQAFTAQVEKVALKPPRIPFVSNVTGDWITATEATDPAYWGRHLRQTVRFAHGLRELLKEPERILLEVGPGRTLSALAGQQPHKAAGQIVLASLRHPQDQQPDEAFLLNTLGRLWLAGAPVDWPGLYTHERRRRIPLPTYPFERRRYWVEPRERAPGAAGRRLAPDRKPDMADWFYVPVWRQAMLPKPFTPGDWAARRRCWLVFVDQCGVGDSVVERLAQEGQDVIVVQAGERLARVNERTYTIDPRAGKDYAALLQELRQTPDAVLHLWSLTPRRRTRPGLKFFREAQDLGFYSLLFLIRALKERVASPPQIEVVSSHTCHVTYRDVSYPEKATTLAARRVIAQEYPNVACRLTDVVVSESGLIAQLLAEIRTGSPDAVVAYRGRQRWVRAFEPVRLESDVQPARRLRPNGVYLVAGGLTGLNLALVEHLTQAARAKVILVEPLPLPGRDEWPGWLATHDEQDETSRKIRTLQALAEQGTTILALDADAVGPGQKSGVIVRKLQAPAEQQAEVLSLTADVAGPEQMQSVLALIDKRFGELNGVIHTAQPAGGTDPAIHRFEPGARGLYALEQALAGRELDFCLWQSSLSSAPADAAIDSFADAFVSQHNRANGAPWIGVHWDAWRLAEEGTAAASADPAQWAITPQEGTAVFRRILSSTAENIVVSARDLSARQIEPLPADKETQTADSSAIHHRPDLQNVYVASRNELERAVADVWQKLFGIEQIGIHDNFFDLGGHSLLATQVVSRLRDTFEVGLSLPTLFEAPTVAGVAESIEAARRAERGWPAPPILPVPRDGELPLSFSQQRLWFVEQLAPDAPPNNIPIIFQLTGPLDVAALERSINELVRRHESLRTTFAAVEGRPVQVIAPALSLTLPVVNLTLLPEPERQTQAHRLAVQESERRFDLRRGPLLRFTLLLLDAGQQILVTSRPHIAFDGWSQGIFFQELMTLYQALAGGQPSPLPELPIQYADFCHWQRQWLQGEVLEALLAYWQQQLDGVPVLQLPADRPRPAVQTFRGASQPILLAPALSESLEALGQQEGVTLFMILLTAFSTLLHRYTGQDDLSVGTFVANRNRSEVEGLIGLFINNLVLRINLAGDPSFRELLGRVRRVALEAYAHQDLPFEKLLQALRPERSLSHTPLFQVMCVVQNMPQPTSPFPDVAIDQMLFERTRSNFDLTLWAWEGARWGFLEYNADLFERATIARMVQHLQTLLTEAVAEPEQPISVLARLVQAGRRALPTSQETRPEPARTFVAPRIPVEEVLAGIWARVLQLERVGVHDNFFELGGHSILIVQIIAQAALAGLALTPRLFFQHQTIAGLAAAIGAEQQLQTVDK